MSIYVNKFKPLISKSIKTMIQKQINEWPPSCSFLAYEPVKPSVLLHGYEKDEECEVKKEI